MKNFTKYFATLFGIGFISIAPGTFGSLFAIFIWYVFIDLFSNFYFIILFLIVLSVSFYFTDIYLDNYKKKDPTGVFAVPPPGPATPVTDRIISLSVIFLRPLVIARAVWWLTAP